MPQHIIRQIPATGLFANTDFHTVEHIRSHLVDDVADTVMPTVAALWAGGIALVALVLAPVIYSYTYYKKQVKAGTYTADPLPQSKAAKMAALMNSLRNNTPTEFAGIKVKLVGDYLKETITENTLLLAALSSLSSAAVSIEADKELKAIKHILNALLDPAISRSAIILTNQSGFDLLDGLEDGIGRPLMQWNPTDGTPRFLHSHRVAVVSDAVMPNTTTGTGDDAVTTAPIYIGDGKQYATLFERAPMEVLSTNIGGNAFTNDTIEIRFLTRMGVSAFDTAAMKMGKLTV